MFPRRSQTAVVIPVHNGRELMARCLKALRRLDGAQPMVIVIDDGSTDGTSEWLRAEHPDVHVLRGNGSLWWTGAVQEGCEFAIAEGAATLVLLNNDNFDLSPNLLTRFAEVIAERGGCVGAIALQEDEQGSRRLLQAGGTLDWRRRGIGMVGHREPYEPREPVEIRSWLPGCAIAFSRGTFELVGGFDATRFPQYRGDIDFTLRVTQTGLPCTVATDTWVVNDRTQTGLSFAERVPLRQFIRGFTSLRSNYNVRETFRFALKYCPRHLLAWHLAQFYARYVYGYVKTLRPRPRSLDVAA